MSFWDRSLKPRRSMVPRIIVIRHPVSGTWYEVKIAEINREENYVLVETVFSYNGKRLTFFWPFGKMFGWLAVSIVNYGKDPIGLRLKVQVTDARPGKKYWQVTKCEVL